MIKKKSCNNCKHLKEVYHDIEGFLMVDYKCGKGHAMISFSCKDYDGDVDD